MQKMSSQTWSYLLVISRSRKMSFAIKIIVAILLIWVIYKDINGYISMSSRYGGAGSTLVIRWAWLGLILAMALVNWTIETWKWTLIFKGQKPFMQALKEVLVGVTSGLITPGRIGEYFGRHYVSEHGSLAANISGTFLSSVSQNFANIFVGLLALLWFESNLMWMPSIPKATILVVVLLAAGVTLYLTRGTYFRLWLDKMDMSHLSMNLFAKLLLLSVIRYSFYATQFALMFWALGANVEFFNLLSLVAIVYLIQSGLPLPPFLAALARIEIALLIFSYHIDNELLIVSSTLLIWIINVVSPALLGWVYLLKSNRQ